MCDHALADGPLICTRTDVHVAGKGCTYAASWTPDKHDQTEATDD